MNVYLAFPERKWNIDPIPNSEDSDPNRAFFPIVLAKNELLKRGHTVLPINELYNDNAVSGDNVVISFDAMQVLPKNMHKKYRLNKLVHFFMEAPMVGMGYYAQKYQNDVFKRADAVFVQDLTYLNPCFRKSDKLKEFRYAHSHLGVEKSLFGNLNRKLLVLINANKGISLKLSLKRLLQGVNPLSYFPHWLFRERNHWVHYFAQKKAINVFGYGWDGYSFGISHISSPLENQSYRGTVKGPKFPILAQYDFCLCFENSSFPGYVTEKIFDCFATGTIPIYRGAPNITEFLPEDSFINLLDFNSRSELLDYISNMDCSAKTSYRDKMKEYLNNNQDDKFSPLKMADMIVQLVEKG